MLSLTPLQFPQRISGTGAIGVDYGHSTYRSSCSRFWFSQDDYGWFIMIDEYHEERTADWSGFDEPLWAIWLEHVGLNRAHFSTRREAVDVLSHHLQEDPVAVELEAAELASCPPAIAVGFVNGQWTIAAL